MRSAVPLAALTLTVAVLLTGCFPQDPEVALPPEPASEPIFSSDEEALAAATDAYKAYLAMSDLIAQEGGKDPERIAPFVTEEWLEEELSGFGGLQSSRRHQSGGGSLTSSELQSHLLHQVAAYYCMNLSNIRVLDERGVDVTPESRPSELTVEVQFIVESVDVLKVDGIEPWPGAGIC